MCVVPLAIGAFTAEERMAGELFGLALRRSGVTPKQAAAVMEIDEPMVSRWVSGERPVNFAKVLRLAMTPETEPALEEFGELFCERIGLPVITRSAIACLARLLHHRPRPVRARLQAGERERIRA